MMIHSKQMKWRYREQYWKSICNVNVLFARFLRGLMVIYISSGKLRYRIQHESWQVQPRYCHSNWCAQRFGCDSSFHPDMGLVKTCRANQSGLCNHHQICGIFPLFPLECILYRRFWIFTVVAHFLQGLFYIFMKHFKSFSYSGQFSRS